MAAVGLGRRALATHALPHDATTCEAHRPRACARSSFARRRAKQTKRRASEAWSARTLTRGPAPRAFRMLWQDIARDPTDLTQGYKSAAELVATNTWDLI